MTFRRFIQILGHLCHWAGVIFLLVVFMQAAGIARVSWLGDVLRERPLVVWINIGSLFLFDLYTRPPIQYKIMDQKERAALNQIPLSRLYGRSTGLLFLEIVALLAVASIAAVILAFPIIDFMFGQPGHGVNQAYLWGFGIGYVMLGISLNLLRSYIYPLP